MTTLDLLLEFGEYLDGEGLVASPEESGDGRSHEELARDFLLQRAALRAK